MGYDRRVVRELRGRGHLRVAGIPAVEHIAFARGLGHRRKRLGGVHRHGHRGSAIGQRALVRIERHDGARLGVGHRKGHDLVALGVHARGALLGLVRGARAVGVLIAHGLGTQAVLVGTGRVALKLQQAVSITARSLEVLGIERVLLDGDLVGDLSAARDVLDVGARHRRRG